MDRIQYTASPDKAITLIEGDYQHFAFERHYHLDFHIGMITSGEQRFQYKGSHHNAGKGEVVIMQPDELHDGYSVLDSGYHVRVLAIQPNWFTDNFDLAESTDMISFNQHIVRDSSAYVLLTKLHSQLSELKICQLAKDCLPYEGLSSLVERYGAVKEVSATPLGKRSIELLKEFLLENLDQPIRLAELAHFCHLSPTQFQRHFKARIGITPYAWLGRLRLEQGLKLINSGISGTEVAHRVGFYDQAHFTKAFKQAFGVCPSSVKPCQNFTSLADYQ